MSNVKPSINETDIFKGFSIDDDLLDMYYKNNNSKKSLEVWLKEQGTAIKQLLLSNNTLNYSSENYVAIVTVPDTSKFDDEKVLDFLRLKGEEIFNKTVKVKYVVDEYKLEEMINNGEINLEELKSYAWEEKQGAPRLTIKQK